MSYLFSFQWNMGFSSKNISLLILASKIYRIITNPVRGVSSGIGNCLPMKHNKSKPRLLQRHVSTEWLLCGYAYVSAQYALCGQFCGFLYPLLHSF